MTGISHNIIIRKLIRVGKQPLILPFYHNVCDEMQAHTVNLFKTKTTESFKNDLEFLMRNYTPVSLDELISHTHNKKPFSKPSFHLTFDDGLRSASETIMPILKSMGIPATFFINTSFIANKNMFYRHKASILINEIKDNKNKTHIVKEIKYILHQNGIYGFSLKRKLLSVLYSQKNILDDIAGACSIDFNHYLKTHRPYMSIEEINSLVRNGFSIGSHSIDHPKYSTISFQEQIRQTTESIDEIKKFFNVGYNVFSFPFSEFNVKNDFFKIIHGSNNPVLDLSFGIQGLKKNRHPHHLHRISMESCMLTAGAMVFNKYFF